MREVNNYSSVLYLRPAESGVAPLSEDGRQDESTELDISAPEAAKRKLRRLVSMTEGLSGRAHRGCPGKGLCFCRTDRQAFTTEPSKN